jgi:hypothetical protein
MDKLKLLVVDDDEATSSPRIAARPWRLSTSTVPSS